VWSDWAAQDSNTPRETSGKPHSPPTGAAKGAADSGQTTPGAGDLAELLRTLERLPLTDAERAEAVRRLLADERNGNP